jgi:hypothetical protein
MSTRDELKRAYKESRPQMGVLLIRNTRSGRFDVRSSVNLRGAMNRLDVEVTPSTNPNRELQDDWRTLGREAFEVKVLDVLEPPADAPAGWDPKPDLAELQRMWRERLVAEGGVPY